MEEAVHEAMILTVPQACHLSQLSPTEASTMRNPLTTITAYVIGIATGITYSMLALLALT